MARMPSSARRRWISRLTSREMRGQRLPMAGVPFHAIDRYLARLLAAGHKAALAEQMEDPKLAQRAGEARYHAHHHPGHGGGRLPAR